jgi:curved DNA-binding protein CbpA
MADCFALLSLPPRAALDDETLQQAYIQASRNAHPDQEGGDAALSAALNAALETLKSPATRLKHLIEQHSQTPWRPVPLEPALMSLFEQLGPLLQQSALFLSRKQAASTALAKALLASEEMRWREALESLNEQLEQHWQQLQAALPECDARLAAGDDRVWAELQSLQARFAYLQKWRSQIRERLLGLML